MADRRAALWAVMAAFLAICCMPRGARAHGFMAQPAARNVIHSSYYPRTPQQRAALPESYWNYCPHCLAAGGPGAVSQNSALTWPEGRAGLCGDMYDGPRDHEAGGRYATEEVAGTYEEGSTMEIKIGITAHHNGRFEFKICRISAPADGQTWVQAEKAQLTQECFNQHVLVQANMKGAQRPYEQFSYLPFKTWGGYSFDLSPPYYSFYYTVPDSLGCDGVKARCILQWHWVTGNSCTPPGTPDEYREKAINECGSTAPYPEEFWNCADILTAPRTNRPPSPPSPPSPPPRPPAPPIQSPPPPPPPAPVLVGDYPCSAGDAYCFCNWKGASGSFADPKKNCEFFYQCATGQYFYTACPGGLRYREDGDYCDLPTNVACKASGTSPGGQASPSASLSPSPRPPPPVSRSPPPRPPPNSPPPKLPPPVNSPPPNSPPTNPPPTQRSPPRPPPPRPFPPQPSPSPPPPSPVTVLRLPSPQPPSPPAPVIRRPPPPPPSRRRWTWWG